MSLEKYWKNPQFLLIITELDIVSKEGCATLIISLMQQIDRNKKLKKLSSEEYIQYRLYQVLLKLKLLKLNLMN